jgi:peptidoglycan/LPS O-acetylase OafA/YrhL
MLAAGVIACHSWQMTSAGDGGTFLGKSLGVWCVVGFFALSGALITSSWRGDPDLARFARRRAARILPAYATAFLICALIVAPLCGAFPTLRDVGLFLTIQPPAAMVFHGRPVDAPMYTIAWECLCYAAVPIFYRVFRERPVLPIGLLAILLLIAPFRQSSGVFVFLPAFLAGALASSVKLPRRPLPRVPDISYGTYLYGWPIQGCLLMAGVRDPRLMLALALPLALCAGWLSFRFVERPAMEWGRRLVRPMAAAI